MTALAIPTRALPDNLALLGNPGLDGIAPGKQVVVLKRSPIAVVFPGGIGGAEVNRMVTLLKRDFLGLPLAAATTREFISALLDASRERTRPFVVGYLNAATVNMAFDSAEYARLQARMDCLYADGQAVVWAARWLGQPIPERVNAGDFTVEMARALAAHGLKLALVGGRPGEARRAAETFQRSAPTLRVVYTHHGFFEDADGSRILAELEAADPDLVLLGMGSPKQERWALEWAARGRPRALWCVGALFEYHAGTRWRAPVWMRRVGLEWAFRLALEPWRLWKRYVVGNPLFLARVLSRRAPCGSRQA